LKKSEINDKNWKFAIMFSSFIPTFSKFLNIFSKKITFFFYQNNIVNIAHRDIVIRERGRTVLFPGFDEIFFS